MADDKKKDDDKKGKKDEEHEPDIHKVPVAKLRVAPSTLVFESESEDSIDLAGKVGPDGKIIGADGKVQKYQMYLGGFSKDQLRKQALEKKKKEKAEKKAAEKLRKEKERERKFKEEKVKDKKEKEESQAANVVDRKKMKLLHDGTYEDLDDVQDLVYYHNPRTRVYLIFVFILMEAFGIAFLTLIPIYSIMESGTIELYLDRGYRRKGKTIHYTIGALWIFIFGNGFIIFRITSAYKLTVLKWIHALAYAAAIPLPLYCVNSYYKVKEENADVHLQEHYYSLHSFFGFLAIYLYIFEVCCGVIVYTLFFFKQVHRNIYYQIHTYVALLGFVFAISTFCLGINMEENDIKVKAAAPTANILVYLNLSGVFVCLFAVFALFLIINPDFDVEKDMTRQ